MVILATVNDGDKEIIVGLGQFSIYEESHTAEVAFVVRDSWQGNGIGSELLNYLTHLAVKQGLQGFTAEVLAENKAMLHLFEKMNFDMKKSVEAGTYELDMKFRGKL
jgi:RimJ/RimL family protein N-acetyltransferase